MIVAAPGYAAAAMAQSCRRKFAAAIVARDFARDCFLGFPSNDTHRVVVEAEDEVLYARANLEEWVA